MAWKSNLLNNLLVITILITIAMITYCKIRKKTFIEVVKDIKEMMSPRVIDE